MTYPIVSHFNLSEILAAKTDFTVETRMIMKVMDMPGNTLSLQEAAAAVHDLVHVSKHYFVVDGEAPVI